MVDTIPEVAAISGKLESSKKRLCPLWVPKTKQQQQKNKLKKNQLLDT